MKESDKNRKAQILAELTSRVETLLSKKRSELLELPVQSSEKKTILDKDIEFNTYREIEPDGTVLLLVRYDEPKVFGFINSGKTEGFWVTHNDERRPASDSDVLEFFA